MKKYIPLIIICIVCMIVTGITVFLITYYNFIPKTSTNNNENNVSTENTESNNSNMNIPTEGNKTIISTKSQTFLRIINEYDKSFFTAKKNLLIMFASWCPNCQEEISEIEKILDFFADQKDINVVLIAHEYDNTINDLISLVENDVNFGDVEVKVDLKRIIRKTIDPEASTIPISYVIDKSGKVLSVHNDSLTLEKAIEMTK